MTSVQLSDRVDVTTRRVARASGATGRLGTAPRDSDGCGRGRLVLLSGEAGVGKTALIRAFCESHGHGVDVVWGACDALFTPRPLGPFLDIAPMLPGETAARVHAVADRTRSPTP